MTLLILKSLIAFIFGFSGANKMYFDEKTLVAKGQTGVEGLNIYFIKFIGFSEVLGSLAIALGFFITSISFLPPIAAICLGVIMIPAAFIHFKRGEFRNVLINILIFSTCVFIVYTTYNTDEVSYKSEALTISQISTHLFVHTSYLDIEGFGKFPCNGMIYRNNNEVIIFDTPTDNKTSKELINLIEKGLNSRIIAIIPTHFHVDCLGGLEAFHDRNIPSYAYEKTIQLAQEKTTILPQIKMTERTVLTVGNQNAILRFFGEGHTKDNIVAYIPSEKALFGGCLIKELNTGKGNLTDANTSQWSKTVETIKQEYPNIKHVIPGHGQHGDRSLLEYTIQLFKE